jgi:replication initiation and membrane attachment protein DnaB
VHWRTARKVIKGKILLRHHFSKQNYLASVHREVLSDMKDCLQGSHSVALYQILIQELFLIEARQHRVNVDQSLLQFRQKLRPGYQISLIKLSLPFSGIEGAA